MSIFSKHHNLRWAPRSDLDNLLPCVFCSEVDGEFVIEVKETDFPNGSNYFKRGTKSLKIPLRDLMFCAGIIQSPSPNPMSLSSWGFWLEHRDTLVLNKNGVRYSDYAAGWDARVKQLYSERLSCGLAAWCMWNIDSVIHIADAGGLIDNSTSPQDPRLKRGRLSSTNLYDDLKPDFFCVTSEGECVIAECKGSLGAPGKLTAAIAKGKQQVSNVRPIGINMRSTAGQLVFAMNLRGKSENVRSGADSRLNVVDPVFGETAVPFRISADEIALESYCKALSFFGASEASQALLSGRRFDLDDILYYAITLGEQLKMLPFAIDSNYLYGMDFHVATELFCAPLKGLAARLEESERPTFLLDADADADADHNTDLILPNGVMRVRLKLDWRTKNSNTLSALWGI